MSLRRKRLFGGLVIVVGASVGLGLAFAQQGPRVNPETLLPQKSVLYLGMDGSAAHEQAWKETAAYESLYQSGLMDVLTKLFASIQEQSGGRDGIPGQLGGALKHVAERGLSAAVTLGPGDGQPPAPWAIVVLHDAADFEEKLARLAVGAARGEIDFQTKLLEGRKVTQGLVPRTPGIEIGWWQEKSHLVIVAGLNAVRSALDVADGGANITASPLWQKYARRDAGFDVHTVGWLDFAALRETFGGIPLPVPPGEAPAGGVTVNDVVTLLGLDSLETIAGRSGYRGRALWSEMNVDAPGPRRGLLALSDQEPITLDDLPPLPARTTGFGASSLDWAKCYDVVLEIARGIEPLLPSSPRRGKVDEGLAKLREELGFDLKADLLEPLGNVHCVYADSTQAPFGLGFGVAIAIDDADRLRTTIDVLLSRLQQEAGRDVSIRRVKKHGEEVVLLEFAQGAGSPALCIGEKWLSLGIVPQTVEAFLMREQGQLARWEPSAELQQALADVPEEFTAIGVSDPRSTYQLLMGFAPFLLGAAKAGLREGRVVPPDFEFPVSMADIPPAELVTRPLFPNVSTAHPGEDGMIYTSRSSLPGLPFTGAVDGGTAVATSAVLTALLLPAVSQAREAARRTQSRNNLKQIMLALHNYHDVYGQFPEGTHPNEKLKPDERLSWQAKILPFLDQAPLYNEIDFEEGWEDDPNAALMKTRISIYQNPSVTEKATEYATTHYVGLAGLGKDGPELPVTSPRAGMFGYNRGTRLQDIRDGTSNTIAVSDGTDHGPWGAGGKATLRALTEKPYVNGPDGIGSPHVGGFQAGLGDGSIRFISENIDPSVLEALVTIRGGEVIGDF